MDLDAELADLETAEAHIMRADRLIEQQKRICADPSTQGDKRLQAQSLLIQLRLTIRGIKKHRRRILERIEVIRAGHT